MNTDICLYPELVLTQFIPRAIQGPAAAGWVQKQQQTTISLKTKHPNQAPVCVLHRAHLSPASRSRTLRRTPPAADRPLRRRRRPAAPGDTETKSAASSASSRLFHWLAGVRVKCSRSQGKTQRSSALFGWLSLFILLLLFLLVLLLSSRTSCIKSTANQRQTPFLGTTATRPSPVIWTN